MPPPHRASLAAERAAAVRAAAERAAAERAAAERAAAERATAERVAEGCCQRGQPQQSATVVPEITAAESHSRQKEPCCRGSKLT